MRRLVLALALLAAVLLAAAPLSLGSAGSLAAAEAAQAPVISATEAHARAKDGELLLIDVRHPQEWRQTGVPAPAAAISIHDPAGLPAFLAKVRRLTAAQPDTPVALICATGARSTFAAGLLQEQGYAEVYNLAEGMLGSSAGPGWLRRDLPTAACQNC